VESTEKHGYEVINFGCYEGESCCFSYIEVAVMISILLSSKALDFVVTGCSSGQGMMLACNSLPNVICGYVENPQDAFLFGRINDGNAVSIPLGLNFGWAGEINLQCTLEKLFEGEFGVGYPPKEADRKRQDTLLLKKINALTKRNAIDVLEELDEALLKKVIRKNNVVDYILEHGQDKAIVDFIKRRL
jgi:ribose 5-phosphate isomerase RpiB